MSSITLPQTKIVTVNSANDFLDVVRDGLLLFNDAVPRQIFRGVGDSRHGLIPSALRKDSGSRGRLKRFLNITKSDIDINKYEDQVLAEVEILRLFYQNADKYGLTLPSLNPLLHATLSGSRNDISSFPIISSMNNDWPKPELRPILALAQHYGLPTRLLDWTIDPYIAMYFAADRGTHHLENSTLDPTIPPVTHIGVWQTDFSLLSHLGTYYGFGNLSKQLDVVHAPRGGNPNLTAQKGLFTIFAQTYINPPSTSIDYQPLNKIIADEIDNPDTINNQHLYNTALIDEFKEKLGDNKIFTLYVLPILEAPILLSVLHRNGYDAARIFPGFGGVALAVENLSRLTVFSPRTAD